MMDEKDFTAAAKEMIAAGPDAYIGMTEDLKLEVYDEAIYGKYAFWDEISKVDCGKSCWAYEAWKRGDKLDEEDQKDLRTHLVESIKWWIGCQLCGEYANICEELGAPCENDESLGDAVSTFERDLVENGHYDTMAEVREDMRKDIRQWSDELKKTPDRGIKKMSEKSLMTSKIESLMQEYVTSCMTPQVSSGKMNHDEFSAIVEKWQLSTGFLKVFLGKSESAIQGYKYRKDHAITGSVAVRIRQLDAVLESMRQQTR